MFDCRWFDLDANSSGKLAACLATDASHIRGAVGDVAALAFQNLSVLVVGYVVACIHDWRMALLVTGAAPLVAVGGFLRIRFMVGASSGSDKLYSEANQTVSEAVASIRVIQAYRLEGYVDQLYRHMLQGTNKEAFKASLAGGIGLGYATMTMYAIYALITWFGGLEVSSCRATFQQFLTAFMAVIFAAMGASQAQVGDVRGRRCAFACDRTDAVLQIMHCVEHQQGREWPQGHHNNPQASLHWLRGCAEPSLHMCFVT